MKKILFLLSIVLLSSCDVNSNGSDTKETAVLSAYAETFRYKGHFYINFGGKGIVHDPDCQYCYDRYD